MMQQQMAKAKMHPGNGVEFNETHKARANQGSNMKFGRGQFGQQSSEHFSQKQQRPIPSNQNRANFTMMDTNGR
jgi:hypothetical protein